MRFPLSTSVSPQGRSLLKAVATDPGEDSAESLLETPTYSVVLVLLTFQAVSIVFTVVVKGLQHVLRTRRRFGLLEALNHSVHELTLLGFVSIVLLSLEQVIADVCIDASYFRADWTILQFVYGEGYCPCCLENTSNVQACVRAYAACGDQSGQEADQFCNCDMQDPTCVESYNVEGSTEPYEEKVCDGPVALDGSGTCGPGKVRAVSILALEQTHYLIFLLSIVHVVCGFVLYGLAWMRVRWEWGRWEKDHDERRDKVNQVLEGYYSGLTTTLQRRSMGQTSNVGGGSTVDGGTAEGDDGPEEHGGGEVGGGKLSTISCPPGLGDNDNVNDTENPDEKPRKGRNTVAFTETPHENGGPPKLERRSLTLPAVLGRETADDEGGFIGLRRSLTRSKSFHNLVSLERQVRRRIFKRTSELTKSLSAQAADKAHTLLQGTGPLIVSKSQYYKLRASFIYTHKLGSNFNFLQHVMDSMEDDLAHLVGITPFFWLITMIFWLISGVIGYAVTPFMALTAILMIVLNAKLVSIVKDIVSRLGTGHALILEERIFWFNRPTLMLQPMKFCLFFVSYIWTSFIFFAWQFGSKSCAFTDPFYGKSWVLPWWTIIIFNAVIFLHLATVTFPAYSLAVQMGSNLKGHMLPSRFVKKLLKAVDDAKRQVQEEDRIKREQSGAVGGKDAVMTRLFRRSAGNIGAQAGAVLMGLPSERTVGRSSSDKRWV